MLEVKDDLLQEFKGRMHFTHSSEDTSLTRLLSLSYSAIRSMVGTIDINVNDADSEEIVDLKARARELVLERSRYVYNEALEYFNTYFSNDISSVKLAFELEEIELDGEEDETI